MTNSDSKSVGGRPKKDDAHKFMEHFQTRFSSFQATAFHARARRRDLSTMRLMNKIMTGIIMNVNGIVIAYEDIANLRTSCGRLSEIESLRNLIQRLEEGDDRA